MSPTDMEFAQLSERVATLERAVEFLLAQGGSQPQSPVGSPPLIYADVVELKRQGKVIEAIKAYRLKTNAGLAEAKQFVDNLKV
jgi:ribosomal protein L7/L12